MFMNDGAIFLSFYIVVNVLFRGIGVYITYKVGENVLSTVCLASWRMHICVIVPLSVMECANSWLGELLSNRYVYRLTIVLVEMLALPRLPQTALVRCRLPCLREIT